MRVGSVQSRHAAWQHGVLVHALRDEGAFVHAVPFVHGAFDSVYSKDNAILAERVAGRPQAFLAYPRYQQRRAEQHARAEALAALGIRVAARATEPLEGGDVVLLPGLTGAFVGQGFRSSPRGARELERFLERPVTTLQLCDERLYHLDMALSILDDGTALVCREAMTTEAFRRIERHAQIRDIVVIAPSEALAFAANLVQVGSTIIWAADAPRTSRELERRGYVMRKVALDQFHRGGGSAACLVSRVHLPASAIEPLTSSMTPAA